MARRRIPRRIPLSCPLDHCGATDDRQSEIKPGTTAIVTIGTIHGGLKRNIISDEVKLELTLRAFDDGVMAELISSIRRICAGTAQAAGVPESRLPVITVTPETTPVTVNDGPLARRLAGVFADLSARIGSRSRLPAQAARTFRSLDARSIACRSFFGG